MANQDFDLAQIAEALAREFPAVEELYLFGSRRYRTQSQRSDVDILVIASERLRPAELRSFAQSSCPALDLFITTDGRATSCQNESFVEAATLEELVATLSAVRFWSRSEGRLAADIDWTFTLHPDIAFIPTALPNGAFGSAASSPPKKPAELTIGELISGLEFRQLWRVVGALLTVLVAGECARLS